MEKINQRGITLIALIITIVVLIILTTVVIQLSLGDNGLFNRVRAAKEQYQNAQYFEEAEIAKYANDIDIYSGRNYITMSEEDLSSLIETKVREGIYAYKTENDIGEVYETKTLLKTAAQIVVGSNNMLSLTLDPGKYVISGYVYASGSNLNEGCNQYIGIDDQWLWADEGHSSVFRGGGTIIKTITSRSTVYLFIYKNQGTISSIDTNKTYLRAIKISD